MTNAQPPSDSFVPYAHAHIPGVHRMGPLCRSDSILEHDQVSPSEVSADASCNEPSSLTAGQMRTPRCTPPPPLHFFHALEPAVGVLLAGERLSSEETCRALAHARATRSDRGAAQTAIHVVCSGLLEVRELIAEVVEPLEGAVAITQTPPSELVELVDERRVQVPVCGSGPVWLGPSAELGHELMV